jgi:hypothetical protein
MPLVSEVYSLLPHTSETCGPVQAVLVRVKRESRLDGALILRQHVHGFSGFVTFSIGWAYTL